MSVEERKQAVPADEVGAALHTALRKLCDGPESVYLWNVIHLLGGTWGEFCTAVVMADVTDGAGLRAVAEDREWQRRAKEAEDSHYARTIFLYALERFGEEDGDWDSFAGYLGPEA